MKLLIFLCRNEENVSIHSGRLRMFYLAMQSYFQHRSVDPIHFTLLLYFTQIWACLVIADHAYIKLIFVFSFIECLFLHQKLFHDFSFLYLHKKPQIDSSIPSEDLLWFKKEAFFLSGFSFSDTFTNRLVKGFWAKFWEQEFSQTWVCAENSNSVSVFILDNSQQNVLIKVFKKIQKPYLGFIFKPSGQK